MFSDSELHLISACDCEKHKLKLPSICSQQCQDIII